MQPSLGVLCVCIAESYVRFVRAVEAKTLEASDEGKKLQIALASFHHVSTCPSQPHAGNEPPSIMIEISVEQWKGLMYNAVKSEMGDFRDYRDQSFMAFVKSLEDRQTDWHRKPRAPDCPPAYQSTCLSSDETPLCLTIVKAAKKVLDQIAHVD